jgi:hypothetical protein
VFHGHACFNGQDLKNLWYWKPKLVDNEITVGFLCVRVVGETFIHPHVPFRNIEVLVTTSHILVWFVEQAKIAVAQHFVTTSYVQLVMSYRITPRRHCSLVYNTIPPGTHDSTHPLTRGNDDMVGTRAWIVPMTRHTLIVTMFHPSVR